MSPAKDDTISSNIRSPSKRERESTPPPICIETTIDCDVEQYQCQKRNGRKRPRPSSTIEQNESEGPRFGAQKISSMKSVHTHTPTRRSIGCVNVHSTRDEGAKSSSTLEISKSIIPYSYNAETEDNFTPDSPVRSIVSCDADAADDISTKTDNYNADIKCNTIDNHFSRNSEQSVGECFAGNANAGDRSHLQFLHHHVSALRIEASLMPFKTLISRLMSNCTFNKKGIFNTPVDHAALGLNDYLTIIKRPMDLGTIKARVYANSYSRQDEVVNDIRLVFHNAMLYNPQNHPVNIAASNLLQIFEEGYASIRARNSEDVSVTSTSSSSHLLSTKARHTCQSCLGRRCGICREGCLTMEPSLLICAGPPCAGSRIRRGATYFCSTDGAKSWCQRCHSNLPAILPTEDGDTPNQVRYKRQLIKRKNDEDAVERWITCSQCRRGFHEVCVFHNEFGHNDGDYCCPFCKKTDEVDMNANGTSGSSTTSCDISSSVYTFVVGEKVPRALKSNLAGTYYDSSTLPHCSISRFIEEKVRETLLHLKCPEHSEKTLSIRIISDCQKSLSVPDVIRRHFQMQSRPHVGEQEDEESMVPSTTDYVSKAIALFQKIDGIDVCCFCMYVQEYEEQSGKNSESTQKKRVYIAYLDSVEHFRPRELRTHVYHEIIVSYLATAKARGFEFAHIWSCPPTRGNAFVFWSKPASQLTPNREHLLSWYHRLLNLSMRKGVVTDIESLYDFSFKPNNKISQARLTDEIRNMQARNDLTPCPPLLDGDFWMDEATRVHAASINRFLKSTAAAHHLEQKHSGDEIFLPKFPAPCPTIQVASLLRECIMTHKSAGPFCRPVNAAALKLVDYHKIIHRPMDLGTIHSRCLLGEYTTFQDTISDISLVFQNAMRYNPEGNIVHTMADELWKFTKLELNAIVRYWQSVGIGSRQTCGNDLDITYQDYGHVSMKLSSRLCSRSLDVQANIDDDDTVQQNNLASSIESKENTDDVIKALASNSNPLLSVTPNAIAKRMVGDDVWLLDKKHIVKKQKSKKKVDEPDPNKRKASWLGDEVGAAIRRMRTDFFVCYLKPLESMSEDEAYKNQAYARYISSFHNISSENGGSPIGSGNLYSGGQNIVDSRHGLLEFLQYRNFQFDTLRRAKYSTVMLLHYIQFPNTPGLMPQCTNCGERGLDMRWHKVNKAFDERRRSSPLLRTACVAMDRKELCSSCYSKMSERDQQLYVPIKICQSTQTVVRE